MRRNVLVETEGDLESCSVKAGPLDGLPGVHTAKTISNNDRGTP